jgi:hypothetical protein
MPTTSPKIRAYLDRLVSIPDYAKHEGITVTQAHRRIEGGKADTELIGKRVFVVLPAPPAAGGAGAASGG